MPSNREDDRLTPELVSTEVVNTADDIEEFLRSLEVPVHNKWVDLRQKELGAFDYDDVRLVVSYHFEEVEDADE